MPIYSYKALALSGASESGRMEAQSEAQARSTLRGSGKLVIDIREMVQNRQAPSASRHGGRPSADVIANTIRQMSMLIRAGVPLVEGLRSLGEQSENRAISSCLEEMSISVSQGMALSEAFSMHTVFPPLAAEMSKVAEAGGNLAEIIARLAKHLEKDAEIRRKIKSALAYPAVIVCTSFITVVVLVTFILPRFMQLFDRMGAQVPWSTKVLMTLSRAATKEWYLFVGFVALVGYLFNRFARSANGKQKLDSYSLRLPIVGDLVRKVVLGRAMASMATLLSSGVPMIQALEAAAYAANNKIVKQAILAARDNVSQGKDTSQALKESGVFPPLVLQMVASGEKAGELPAMLDHVCALYDQETDAKVKSLTSIIEPVLIVFLGLVVGFIAISVILPIYSLVGGVK